MNRNMFNPEMMNQMKNMIDGKSMKNMLGNMTNMTDDQIRVYLSASGMGHISPQMFRQMAGQMNNMDENELDRMKNMMPNSSQAGFPYQANNTASNANSNQRYIPNANAIHGHNTNKINSSASQKDLNFSNYEPVSKNILDKLERIKIEGNNFFRSGKFKEACEKYYEILNEMDYISDSEKVTYQKQLDDLEIVCRLNIANTKIKQEDYDLVIHECLKVLKKSENFKAHYRAGVAYFKKKSHQKAYHHLVKAKDLNKEGDVDIDKYLIECKTFLEGIDEEKKKSQINEDKKFDHKNDNEFMSTQNNSIVNNNEETNVLSETKQNNNLGMSTELNEVKLDNTINQEINTNESKKTSSKIDKLKEIVDKEVKTESSRDTIIKDDDILIEEKINLNTNFGNSQQAINNDFMPKFSDNMPEKMSQMQKQLDNMDDTQIFGMMGMLRGMDNATIKSMMSMQGMNLTDEQIEMMKNVNPQMLQMAKKSKINFDRSSATINTENKTPNNSFSNSSISSSVTERNISNMNPIEPINSFPNMNNMDINGMFKMIQDNPQLMNMMGPQMANMFGANGGNQEVIMNSMQNILWLISLPQRIKAFLKSSRGMLFISMILILILAYFYNR